MKENVYETPGPERDFDKENEKFQGKLPHSAQNTSNDIEVSTIQPKKAYAEFARIEQYLNAVKEGQQTRIIETPAEKLARLTAELTELKDEIKYVETKGKEMAIASGQNPENAWDGIAALEQEIKGLSDSKEVQAILNSTTGRSFSLENNLMVFKPDVQEKITKELLSKIEILKNAPQSVKNTPDAKSGESNVRYEIFLNRESANIKDVLKYEELEKRLAAIEKFVGFADKNKDDIVVRVNKMSRVIKNMEPGKLDELQAKCQNLLLDFDQLISKRGELQISEEEFQKIQELHGIFSKLQTTIDELPGIIDRLETLKALHEESASFSIKLKELQDTQASIVTILGDNNKLLETVQSNFAENVGTIEKNFKLIEERLAKLK